MFKNVFSKKSNHKKRNYKKIKATTTTYKVKGPQAGRARKIKKHDISALKNKIIAFKEIFWRPKLIGLIALCVLSITLYETVNLDTVSPIKSIVIEGEFKFLEKDDLQKQVVPFVEGGFFNVNLAVIRNELIKLPWVEDVSVRRQWPNKLLVRVIEKQPVVFWGSDSVLSTRGKLFVPEKKLDIEMPLLTGPDGQHEIMLRELARMQAWLIDTELHIKNIDLNARRAWTLKMTTGMELRLGRKDMHERLNRFVSVYNKDFKISKRKIKHIDMRYTNGFAVAWSEVSINDEFQKGKPKGKQG